MLKLDDFGAKMLTIFMLLGLGYLIFLYFEQRKLFKDEEKAEKEAAEKAEKEAKEKREQMWRI